MKVAVISDIHGNYWALTRVLKDLDKRKPDLIINLGDSLYGPLRPYDTFRLLNSCDIISVSGNQDRIITESHENDPHNTTLSYVINDLDSEAMNWLKALPKTQLIENLFYCFHGTPDSDTTYLLEDLRDEQTHLNNDTLIGEYLNGIDARIFLCGHSHTPRLVRTSGRTIINPGSVGLQAYDDDLPVYHKIECKTNMAQYCMLDVNGPDIRAEQIRIQYDYEKAVNCAVENHRPDWAKWLKYGKV